MENSEVKTGEPSQDYSPLRLVGAVWQRRSLLVLGLVIGVALGALYYAQSPTVYQSKAQVLVVKKAADEMTGVASRAGVEDYVGTQQVLVKSPLIINRAVEKGKLATLQSFAGRAVDIQAEITGAMTVTRNKAAGSNNNVLDVSYRGPVANDCQTVLQAVLDSYKEFLDETYRNMSDDTLEQITRARNDLQKELREKEKAYREFREKSPVLKRGREGLDLRQDALVSLQAKRSALVLRRAEIESQLKAVEAARSQGRSREALLAMLNEFASKSDTDDARELSRKNLPMTLQDQIFPLLTEEQKLLQSYGPQHPEVMAIRDKIRSTRDFFTRPSAAYEEKPVGRDVGAKSNTDPVEINIQFLREKLNQISITETNLTKLFNSELDESRKLTHFELEDEAFRNDINRIQQLYDGIVKRIQDVGLVKEVGGFDARTLAAPERGERVAPRLSSAAMGGMALGLLIGLGLVYLAEVTDKSFRSPDEVRRRLGVPVMGYIPVLTPASEANAVEQGRVLDPYLVAYSRPRSMAAEAYRGVRTALYFNTQGDEAPRVIQVTSPNAGDGKSTMAANLAISIAQSGKRALLIDCDLRKPRVRKMFGGQGDLGLAPLIAGEAEVDDCTQESGVPNLSILPCGQIPPNPAELLSSPRFKELLAYLRGQYDFVILDTPPLLAVTDPTVVAAQVDGVVLVVRMVKDGRPAAERAKEILGTLGAPMLGVVLNGMDRGPSGGSGYGKYGYGGGYGNYGYTQYAAYHSEESQTGTASGGVKT